MVQHMWTRAIWVLAALSLPMLASPVQADDFDTTVTGALLSPSTAPAPTGRHRHAPRFDRTALSGKTAISMPGDGSVTVANFDLTGADGSVIGTVTIAGPGTLQGPCANYFAVDGSVALGDGSVTIAVKLVGAIHTSSRSSKTRLDGALFGYNKDTKQSIAARVTGAQVNIAPTLDAIANQTVVVGSSLAVTATATDGNTFANKLTFSLDADSIAAGLTIDAATGAIAWTPTDAQVGTHTATVTVSDSGSPSLSDSKSFDITVEAAPEPPPAP